MPAFDPIKIKPVITKVLDEFAEIRFAYLFGSQAKATAGKRSDVDIAVFLDPELSSDRRYQLRLSILDRLARELRFDQVDLVILNEAPLTLSFRACQGLLLVNHDDLRRTRYEVRTMSRYFDRQYNFRRYDQAVVRQIAERGIQ